MTLFHCLVSVFWQVAVLCYQGKIALLEIKHDGDFQDTIFLLVSTRLKESFRKSLEEMSKRGDDAEEGDSQEEAKGASKLTDQRVEGKYQDLVKYEIMKSRKS